jgi:hypothetical protein
MTKEEAIKLAESKFWEDMSLEDRAMFQLWEKKLCMPFGVFHEAVEKTLGRPVWTHEFAFLDSLKEEMLGLRPAPSMEDIFNLIPAEKRTIVQG